MPQSILKGLTPKAIGILTLMYKYPGIRKIDIMNDHNTGSMSLRSGYKELVRANIVRLRAISSGKGTLKKVYVLTNDGNQLGEDLLSAIPKRIRTFKDKHQLPKEEKKVKKKVVKLVDRRNIAQRIEDASIFYDNETQSNIGQKLVNPYCNLYMFVCNSRPDGERKPRLERLSKQVSFKEFTELHAKASGMGVEIIQILNALTQDGATKGYDSLYLAMDDWLNSYTA